MKNCFQDEFKSAPEGIKWCYVGVYFWSRFSCFTFVGSYGVLWVEIHSQIAKNEKQAPLTQFWRFLDSGWGAFWTIFSLSRFLGSSHFASLVAFECQLKPFFASFITSFQEKRRCVKTNTPHTVLEGNRFPSCPQVCPRRPQDNFCWLLLGPLGGRLGLFFEFWEPPSSLVAEM